MFMKRIFCSIFAFIALLGLVSCAPSYEELKNIVPGMSKEEVVSMYGDYNRIEFVPIGYDDGDYSFFVYDSADGASIAVFYSSDAKVSYVIEIPRTKSDLPTHTELTEIVHGTTREDVIEKYGYPQRYMRNPSAATDTYFEMYYIYDSCDGKSFAILFAESEDSVWRVKDTANLSS